MLLFSIFNQLSSQSTFQTVSCSECWGVETGQRQIVLWGACQELRVSFLSYCSRSVVPVVKEELQLKTHFASSASLVPPWF